MTICHGTRYISHFYCLEGEAGFYSDVVECLPVTSQPIPDIPIYDMIDLTSLSSSFATFLLSFGGFSGISLSVGHGKPKMAIA